MIRGSNPSHNGTQVIMWLGAEDEIRTWNYDYYVVLSGQLPIGAELTKREAWELFKDETAKGTASLSIERWTGGGNFEAADCDMHAVWPPEAVAAEHAREDAELAEITARCARWEKW